MKSKGFTLIELLVVISIISLLSSVIIGALSSARVKSNDNVVKVDMKQMVPQAEIYRDSVTNFSGASDPSSPAPSCTSGVFNDTRISLIKAHILKTNPGMSFTCYWNTTTGTNWAFSATPLKGGGSWCVDNSGRFGPYTAQNTGICQ